PTALLRRQGRWGTLAAVDLAGLAAGGGAAVALAFAGAGPWSLVAQLVVQRFLECTLLWCIAGKPIGLAWSRRDFAELAATLDWRALRGAWPVIGRYAPCLFAGISLGPSAAGLYLLATRLAEALRDVVLAGSGAFSRAARDSASTLAARAWLPAVAASGLLAVALPPLIDLRWWGAVAPAQILLLGVVPAALGGLRAGGGHDQPAGTRRAALVALGGAVVAALAVPSGLLALAGAELAWAIAAALPALHPLRRHLGVGWRGAFAGAPRRCAGAVAAALLLAFLGEPMALALDAVPAFCLLAAAAWLCYLAIRGEPYPALRPAAVQAASPAARAGGALAGDAGA
ncbi:MAG TPA: oligosaccharide flippase family protein, partial [Stellaceae bacterium]|nr:oligosaccharide flippase family protein [Stellaceae bacterium]